MFKKTFSPFAAFLLALVLFAFPGCGGGKTDLTARPISDDQLALMMLSVEDYGPDFREFVLDKESGPSTAEEDIQNDFDPEGEAADIERFGWASGYERSYTSAQSLRDRSGIFSIDSGVEVLDTAEGAAGYLDDLMDEMDALAGATKEGVTVEEVQRFDADVADQAYGLRSNMAVEAEDGSQTPVFSASVMQRRGRLIAWVSFTGFDRLEADEHLKDLASALDQRIVEVLQAQAQAEAAGEEQPEPLVMRPGAVLATSAERFAQKVETFRGTFDMTMTMGDFHIGTKGRISFRSPDTMYMTMDIGGQTMEELVVLPDIYMRLPGEGWCVMTAESMGINREAYEDYLRSQGPSDYWNTAQQLDGLTQLPDEVLDGVTYLHYEGTLDMSEALKDIPEGLYEPGMLEQIEDVLQPVTTELWLDKETYLPHRTDVHMTLSVQGTDFSMDMSMEYSGYNEPVYIPEPPIDVEPLGPGDAADL
jgi:hypothetical protein